MIRLSYLSTNRTFSWKFQTHTTQESFCVYLIGFLGITCPDSLPIFSSTYVHMIITAHLCENWQSGTDWCRTMNFIFFVCSPAVHCRKDFWGINKCQITSLVLQTFKRVNEQLYNSSSVHYCCRNLLDLEDEMILVYYTTHGLLYSNKQC